MRKITRESAEAFKEERKYSKANTTVRVWIESNMLPYHSVEMCLHGNLIAKRKGNQLMVTLAGWDTPTTKERVNGLLSIMGCKGKFYTRKGQTYFEEAAIDSDTEITIDLSEYNSYSINREVA